MRPTIRALSLGALISLALLPPVLAQTPPGAPPPSAPGAPPSEGRAPAPHGRSSGALWFVAEKLAAAEVALAITPEQQPQWRAFAQAAIALAQAGRPGPEAPGAGPGGTARFRQMLEGEVRRGEAAADLSRAFDALGAALSPTQRETADQLLADLPSPFHAPSHGPKAGDHQPPPPPPGERMEGSAPPPRFDKPSLFTR